MRPLPPACVRRGSLLTTSPQIAAQECRRYFAGGYAPAHPAPARLPGSDLEDDAAAEELFEEAMAKLVAYLENRKQQLQPAVAFLLRKYLLELQELRSACTDDVAADDAPRDAFEVFAKRHQPRVSMRFAAEQEEALKAEIEQVAKRTAAEKRAKAKVQPPQACPRRRRHHTGARTAQHN